MAIVIGSVMVWGGFTELGTRDLFNVDGIIKKFLFVMHFSPSSEKLAVVFQQDNDPKHT